MSQTYNGTVTIQNVSGSAINGPFQILLASLTSGVTLVSASGTYNGSPFLTVSGVGSLAPGQSATVNVQFGKIRVTPTLHRMFIPGA